MSCSHVHKLYDQTVRKLKKVAKNNGIKGYSTMTKKQIVKAIENLAIQRVRIQEGSRKKSKKKSSRKKRRLASKKR